MGDETSSLSDLDMALDDDMARCRSSVLAADPRLWTFHRPSFGAVFVCSFLQQVTLEATNTECLVGPTGIFGNCPWELTRLAPKFL